MTDTRYAVVATLGPATPALEDARRLLSAGATGFRLNTSHLGPDELRMKLDTLAPLMASVPVILDLQGSKWRVARMDPRVLAPGDRIVLTLGAGGIRVPHPDFFRAAQASDGRVLLDDARIELALLGGTDEHAEAVVIRGGQLDGRKGVTLPGATYRAEQLTDEDRRVVEAAAGLEGVRLAVSYVRDAPEMERYRAILPPGRRVIAKLERPTAMDQAADIARHCDELWVCRGDLGAEMGMEAMAAAVARVGALLPRIEGPVLMAGQVLEHMTRSPTPTRSEVCHLHDLAASGWAGVVLSDETAVGSHPVEAVRTASLFRDSGTAIP